MDKNNLMKTIKFQSTTILPKYILLLIVASTINTFTVANLSAQQCNFCSQADVDAYNLGGFVFGNIYISGPDITNLDALSPLRTLVNGDLIIYNNPLLENTDGLSLFEVQLNETSNNFSIYNNPKLKRINLPSLDTSIDSISNNNSLDSISIRSTSVNIMNNDSLSYFATTAASATPDDFTFIGNPFLKEIIFSPTLSSIGSCTISDAQIKNLDGFANLTSIEDLTLTDNANLQFYCGLHEVLLNDLNTSITLTSNFRNPTNEEILHEGTCGNFVRNGVGYSTLTEALSGAHDHSFIYVAKDYVIDSTTIFSSGIQRTLIIHQNTTLTFDAPFTNEGIVINHGTLEMLTGSLFTNAGAFVNTGLLIAN